MTSEPLWRIILDDIKYAAYIFEIPETENAIEEKLKTHRTILGSLIWATIFMAIIAVQYDKLEVNMLSIVSIFYLIVVVSELGFIARLEHQKELLQLEEKS